MHSVHDRGVECLGCPIQRFVLLHQHVCVAEVERVIHFFSAEPSGRIVVDVTAVQIAKNVSRVRDIPCEPIALQRVGADNGGDNKDAARVH
jgi:hypothetical protein